MQEKPNYHAHTFYYAWYENPQTDGAYKHWNHDILPHWSDTSWDKAGHFSGGQDIGANFYPQLACYSSNDTLVIEQHMQMIRQAGIGVLAFSWWGEKGISETSMDAYFRLAEKYKLKICFHIEPFYHSAEEFRQQIQFLNTNYGQKAALYQVNNKPFYYIYDSYKLPLSNWKQLLQKEGTLSLRNTDLDATFIGLWVHEKDSSFFANSGFDGFYTYFASDGFVFGSTYANWDYLSDFSKEKDLIFIPCVGPGYLDTRIRPWNAQNSKDRERGKYYQRSFEAAKKLKPPFIAITSFNEWHEGTQIEPAIEKKIDNYTYQDYGQNVSPWFYIEETKDLLKNFDGNANCRPSL